MEKDIALPEGTKGSLTTEELQINGNELVCHSWLWKRSRTTLSWKKLWFVLRRNNQLAIYKDDNEYKPLNIINLKQDDITVSKIVKKDKEKDKFQFALFSPKNKTIHLKASNEFDFNNWFLNLQRLLQSPNGIFIGDQTSDHGMNNNSSISIHNQPQTQRRNSSQQNLTTSDLEDNLNDDDYFTSDNEAPPGQSCFNPMYISEGPIIEENEDEILKEEQELVEEQSSQNKMNLERIKKISPDFMKDYLIEHYSYNSTLKEHIIQKGYLLRLQNLNQWKKFFIVLTNRSLIFYKIHNYSDTKNIDYETLIGELGEKVDIKKSKKIRVLPAKIIGLENLVDVVELDPLSRSKQNCLLIITPKKRYRFCTKTEMELVNWLIIFKSFLIVRKKEIEFSKSP
ncbi:hypothetical protein DASC09_013810 [Saccharomycopsis crataegensis]|uniref:PH domain-containing protein n=1 Tax=Saccharomycopsis crataegensis TaxID=43959 RepID=A0AAV5QH74_9ASCO|nr:hypothetical protein DASC09_013810 [Saccharomycopsis crataegensis]